MQKMTLALSALALALTACGGGGPAPKPQPAPKPAVTLYQGVWGYAYDQNVDSTIDQSGAALFADELAGDFGRVAAGVYADEAQTRQGGALLGPITGKGLLEVALTRDLSANVAPYLVGQDADGRMGSYQNYPTFEGLAGIVDASGRVVSTGLFVMVQVSTEKPASTQAQAALQEQANRLAAQRLTSSGLSAQAQHPRPDFAQLHLNAAELLRR